MSRASHEHPRPPRALAQKIAQTIDALRALDAPLIVAASGGSDSTALLWLAAQSGCPVHAVHFQHHLRTEAHFDEGSVRGNARNWGAQCSVIHLRADELYAAQEGVQAAARARRYAALAALGRQEGAIVLTGHHVEDVFENLALRLEMGCGLAGAFGPKEWTTFEGARVHRPLLGWWKAELRALLQSEGVSWREDASNAETGYRRNALRHALAGVYASLERPERFAQSLVGVAREAWATKEDALVTSEPRRRFFPRDQLLASAAELTATGRLKSQAQRLGGRPRRETLARALEMLWHEQRGFLMDHRILYAIDALGITLHYAEDPRALLARLQAEETPTHRLREGAPLRLGDVELRLEGATPSGYALWVRPLMPGDKIPSPHSGRWVSASARLARDGVSREDRARAYLALFLPEQQSPQGAQEGLLVVHPGRKMAPLSPPLWESGAIWCTMARHGDLKD